MVFPLIILTGIMSVITAPGLIAQYLEERRNAKAANAQTDGHANA